MLSTTRCRIFCLPVCYQRISSSTSPSVTSQALIGLFRPRLIVSSKVFYVFFVHLVYNSASFLASCCSFLLLVLVNLIFFSFSRQLVLLSNFTKFLHSFCGQKGVPGCFSEKFHLDWWQSFFILLSANHYIILSSSWLLSNLICKQS